MNLNTFLKGYLEKVEFQPLTKLKASLVELNISREKNFFILPDNPLFTQRKMSIFLVLDPGLFGSRRSRPRLLSGWTKMVRAALGPARKRPGLFRAGRGAV